MKSEIGEFVTLPNEREILLTRTFRAPLALVHDAFTKPELLVRWFGPRGFRLVVCEVDPRVGGGFRFVLRGPDGRETGMRGEYLELRGPGRSVHMEWFDDFPGKYRVTTEMEERSGETTLQATLEYPTREARDAVLAMGMETGAAESYEKLAALLAEGSGGDGEAAGVGPVR